MDTQISTSQRAEEYRAAERALLAAHGITATVRDLPVASSSTVHVLDVGSGAPLVFVPGGGSTAATWAAVLARTDGYRRIGVDRPGFGLTPMVDLHRRPLRELTVTFLHEVLDSLELPSAVLVGSSMGSWWTTRFAQAHPDRVTALVHIGCPALLLDTSAPAPMRLQGVRGLGRVMQALQQPSRAAARRQLRMCGDPLGDTETDDLLADVLVAMQRMPDHDRAWPDLLHAVVRPRGARPGMAITEAELRELDVPTLLVWGQRDTFGSPAVGERAASLMPDATFVPLPHGHVPWVSGADDVAAAVRGWLGTRGVAATGMPPRADSETAGTGTARGS